MQVTIKDKLYKEIFSYCELNNLDVNEFINDLLKKNFMIEKYGEKPGIRKQQNSEPINEPISEPINEPIKKDVDKKTKEKFTKDVKEELIESELVNEKNQTVEPKKKHRKLT